LRVAELSLFEYIRQTGITGLELCLLLVAAFMGWLGWVMLRERRRARRTPPSEPVTPVIGVVSALSAVLLFCYFAYDLAHHRYQLHYQLRPEASRYVVGTVFRISALKRGPIYNYRYQAQGHSYEGYSYCDSSGCPPVGRRYFITYALADPSFSLSLGLPVPDSLGAAPDQEWTELP
jgi:hypothetical protein